MLELHANWQRLAVERRNPSALRFVEVIVNGPKTWSLAAALHPEFSASLDAAQDRGSRRDHRLGRPARHQCRAEGPPINGIGHAAVATDLQFRAVLAAYGFTLNPESGEFQQLAPHVGAFSAWTSQIRRNVDRYEAAWRGEHPGEEPGPRLREAWDRRAGAEARPDKIVPLDGAELVAR